MRHLLRFRSFVMELFNEHLVTVTPAWIQRNIPAESDYCMAVHERWIEQYGGPFGCTPQEYQIMMNAVIGGGDAVCDLATMYCLDLKNVVDWVELKVGKEEGLNAEQCNIVQEFIVDSNWAIQRRDAMSSLLHFDYMYPPWPLLTGMYMPTNPVYYISDVCVSLCRRYYNFVFSRPMNDDPASVRNAYAVRDDGWDSEDDDDDLCERVSHLMRDCYDAYDIDMIPDDRCKTGYRRQFRYLNDINDYLSNLSEYRAGRV